MNPVKIFFPALFLLAINGRSQESDKDRTADIFKVTFFNPGISYEKGIGKFQTLYAQAFLNTSFSLGYSSALGTTSSLYFDPALMLQYRYYYNAARREKKGKRIAMNSLNYLSPFFETVFFKKRTYTWEGVETYRRTINTIGLVWGMQRNYNSRFSLDFESGIGYRFGKITSQSSSGQISTRTAGSMTLIINVNLGIWLNKRQ